MTGIVKVTCRAVRQPARHLFRQANRKSSVLFSVPKPDGYIHIFHGEAPRLGIHSRVHHNPFSRTPPCAALTFKTRVESSRITQTLRVARLQEFHKPSRDTDRRTHGDKGPRGPKTRTQQLGSQSIKGQHPAMER